VIGMDALRPGDRRRGNRIADSYDQQSEGKRFVGSWSGNGSAYTPYFFSLDFADSRFDSRRFDCEMPRVRPYPLHDDQRGNRSSSKAKSQVYVYQYVAGGGYL